MFLGNLMWVINQGNVLQDSSSLEIPTLWLTDLTISVADPALHKQTGSRCHTSGSVHIIQFSLSVTEC